MSVELKQVARLVNVNGLTVPLLTDEVLVIFGDGSWTRDSRSVTSTDIAKDARAWFRHNAVRVVYGTGEVFTNTNV